MAQNVPLRISFIVISTVTVLVVVNKIVVFSGLLQNAPQEYNWIVHGFLNVLGYATVFLPGYLTYKYIHKINYLSKCTDDLCGRIIQTCFGEDESLPTTLNSAAATPPRTRWQETKLLVFHFLGLQISFVTWGILQEKVMTQEYKNKDDEVEHFKDSQFLVFVNRILAFCLSGVYMYCHRPTRYKCPLYKYAFCSFSNIMSSWCQYEALKYVSFPHQVLAKAAKTIPVMLMGRFVSKTKYEYYEYVTSVILFIGMSLFMLDAGNDRSSSAVTTLSGVILLFSYLGFDSFTSNWQGALFKTYSIKPVQMMCFVNFFSCIFTATSLFQQDAFIHCFNFMWKYPQFIADCILLSICSAVGQLFIFSTISKFGPLVFAIITTIRQGFSILFSCLLYHHVVHGVGIFGIILVFLSILLRIYCGHRHKAIRKNKSAGPI